MKLRPPRIILLCVYLLFLAAACGPNGGVEVGNPKLGGKVVTLNPADRPETYVVSFPDDDSADVSKILGDQFETMAATVTIDGQNVLVEAQFSAGPAFALSFQVNEAGEIQNLSLKLDGVPVSTGFSSQPAAPSLKTFWSNDALLVVATICQRVEECQPETPAVECEADLQGVPGLAQSFGGAPGQSLKETADAIDAGTDESDPAAVADCLAEIGILPCSQVDKGHEPSDPHNYQQAHKLVPKPTCNQAFHKKP